MPGSWIATIPSPGKVKFFDRKAGDANGDRFDQLDITAVRQQAKYRSGEAATFAEGDWNGDGVFDEFDIVTALRAGHYSSAAQTARNSSTVAPVHNTEQKSRSNPRGIDVVLAEIHGGLWPI